MNILSEDYFWEELDQLEIEERIEENGRIRYELIEREELLGL